ncbi:PfkB family carbohydrate kinase [Actinoplanes sp. NPDC023801]|uniref:PfkB family carbohydrate kinase n=1 Tax=Actinoplanes sp. NPDC023801 TaxID=3154595 RepID=UPI0033C14E76
MRPFLIIGESILDVIEGSGTRRALPGGSPANVAAGLGRLGHDVGLWTHLGADPAGDLLRDHLTASGVRLLAPITGVTSQARAEIQPDGSARYAFAVEWPRWPDGPAATETAIHLHTGSIAALLEPGAGDVGKLLSERRAITTISYDPNIRPALAGEPDACRARVEALVAVSDVVKASDEDLEWLYPGIPALDVARRWQASGPALVGVTLGAHGAFAVTGNAHVVVPPVKVTVADTVGAGDSFMSGLLDALRERHLLGAGARPRLRAVTAGDLGRVLSHAALVAAITVSRAGAAPPTREELPV